MSPLWDNSGELSVGMVLAHTFTGKVSLGFLWWFKTSYLVDRNSYWHISWICMQCSPYNPVHSLSKLIVWHLIVRIKSHQTWAPIKRSILSSYLKTPNNSVISQSLILFIILLVDIVGISLETNKHQNAIFWFIWYFEVFFTSFFFRLCVTSKCLLMRRQRPWKWG